MLEGILIAATLVSIFLVVYHHALYPVLLGVFQKVFGEPPVDFNNRGYAMLKDESLPRICIVMPAHNEAEWIREKILNLSILDYPSDRLKIVLACDGCTDQTAEIARQCLSLPECEELDLEVREFKQNRGKVAVLNHVVPSLDADLLALSDVSALISVDALLIAAAHFQDPGIGVLNSHYQLARPGSEGEASYWNYQAHIKSSEAALGATLGAHGAFYMFQKELFEPLNPNTINDDFILPMQIVAKGYRAVHDDRIMALELEQADLEMDHRRRLRISAGNMQQLIWLKKLLLPRYRGVAFAFASGKALRVAMPFLMIIAYAGSITLAQSSLFFLLAALLQSLLYGLAVWALYLPADSRPRMINTLSYIVAGHVAGLLGSLHYLFNKPCGPWKRAGAQLTEKTSELKS